MKLIEKIDFARYLLEEVREDVLANIGSPPFPELERITAVITELDDYVAGHDPLPRNIQRMSWGG